VIPRLLATLALAGALAGCGTADEKSAPAKPGPDGPPVAPPPKPKPKPKPAKSTRARLVITIVNGDTNRRVRRAVVHVGGKRDGTDAKGIAEIVVRRRAPLNVTVRARGYNARTVRMPFHLRRKVTVRIYRKALQWPIFGVDASRTQTQNEISVRPPFKVVWSRGIGSLIEFPAVVSDGVAYIGNYKGTIYAISMRFGKTIWRYDPPGGKMASSPAVVGEELVVHGMDGIVRILDRRRGKLVRQIHIGSPIESSPVVRNGVDYFGAWNGNVYALDLRTGALRWAYRSGYKITSSVALAGATAFIGDYGGRILALSAANGRLRWARSVNGRVYGTPAVADGRVFVPSSTGGSLTAFSTGGLHLWSVHTGSYVYSSPAVWGGRVYFGSYNGVLYAVSARTGARIWTVGAGGPISGAAVVVAGVAYAGSTYGTIVGVDARSGRALLRFPHGEYVPVSGSGGRLLLHGYSRLYAVDAARK
jgi:outer membrane protein assembly factor BamB